MLPIVILHGWSDNSKSFKGLAKWLVAQNFQIHQIHLGDYLSMNDEVTLFDIGRAFRLALEKHGIPQSRHSFNLIVHSTGGLVAREYLRQVCLTSDGRRDPSRTPVQHLCMLAPANFGSPLATLGKSILGRLFKGWKWEGFGESGQQVLNALELAAPYSFDLAVDDLFDPAFPVFSPDCTFTTVMVGTAAYPDALRSSAHKNGSDGTVYVSTASLNASYFRVDFSSKTDPPVFEEIRRTADVAIAVFHRNHGNITNPEEPAQSVEWQRIVLNALRLEPRSYEAHVRECSQVTEQTFAEGIAGSQKEWYHRYQHVAVRVHDQYGAPIHDYMIEFYQEPRDRKDRVFKKINTEILEEVGKNKTAGHYRTFLFDMTDLEEFLARNPHASVEMSISAAHLSKRIRFLNPEKGIEVFGNQSRLFMKPNQPILVDITLHREPNVTEGNDAQKVFRLTRAG